MNFAELKKAEPSLALLAGEEDSVQPRSISTAGHPEPDTFVFLKNKKFLQKLLEHESLPSGLGAVLDKKLADLPDVGESLKNKLSWRATVESVDAAMCSLSKPFYDEKFNHLNMQVDGRQMGSSDIHPEAEISQNVFIGEGCVIEKDVVIMPGCAIMPNSTVKEGTILFPNVTVYPYVEIGRHCRIHSQCVLGGDGFGYNFAAGEHKKIWHFGGVIIGDRVEIGANSCVDAGSFGPTIVGDGTKLDNFVQIAHNNKIGKHCVLCGRAGLAGSVTLEDYVVIGAAGGCAPGALLKKGTQVAAMAVISENAVWGPGETLAGHPARPLKEWLKKQARLNKLAKEAAQRQD